jgi:L-histidine N-alpha-methyltransferase
MTEQFQITDLLKKEEQQEVFDKILCGLISGKKYISSRFFYNSNGSALFEKITALPEYYPTRTEKSILKDKGREILNANSYSSIIELGSGDCSKICLLLDTIPDKNFGSTEYYPVDISASAICKSAELLTKKYPALRIQGILADFIKHLDHLPGINNRLICFLGSTLGNFSYEQSVSFLSGIRSLMDERDSLLLGLDMVKDAQILERAYNDGQGITEAFNKNILLAVNDIAETNFAPENFRHHAYYNLEKARIEMHLIALKDMEISSPLFNEKILIKKDESIHTENSHKFTPEKIKQMADKSGLRINEIFMDEKKWFSLVKLEKSNS